MIVVESSQDPKRCFRRKHLRRQARAAVLGGIVLFVLVQLGMRGWIELRRPDMRDPSFEIKYLQFERMVRQAEQPPAVVAFFGSSMTAHGAKADLVEAPLAEVLGKPVVSFNFATSGAGPFTQLMYLKRLTRRGIRPTLAVIELSPMVYDTSAFNDMPRFPPYILDRHDRDSVACRVADPEFCNEWWQAFLVPIYGHRLTILSQTADLFVPFADRMELWSDMDAHGWRQLDPLPADEFRRILSQVEKKYTERFGKYEIAQTSVNDLHDLVAFLRSEQIPAILVLMPAGPTLRSLYSPERLAPLYAEFKALSASSGFPLIDAQELCGDEKFTDTFHLNSVGADALTRFLVNDVIVPMHRRPR